MSVEIKNIPKYVEDAKFIDHTDNVDEDEWPKNLAYYNLTNKWNNRLKKLDGVITRDQIQDTLKHGELYSSLSNSVTFTRDISGIAIYAIVSAKLISHNGKYPVNPSIHDYSYNAVSIWVYPHSPSKAIESDSWSQQDVEFLFDFCQSESGQSELSKH